MNKEEGYQALLLQKIRHCQLYALSFLFAIAFSLAPRRWQTG
jgi:hypothetical protein